VVPGERPDHVVHVGHEPVVEQVDGIFALELLGGNARDAQQLVLRPFLGVGQELHQQARHEVDRAVHLGELLQMGGHSPVVLDPVHAYPGHQRLTGDVVRVIRLMLVPVECEINV